MDVVLYWPATQPSPPWLRLNMDTGCLSELRTIQFVVLKQTDPGTSPVSLTCVYDWEVVIAEKVGLEGLAASLEAQSNHALKQGCRRMPVIPQIIACVG